MPYDPSSTQNPWYRTGGGITFLGILGVCVAAILIFIGFVGYYMLQIRQGNGPTIQEQIQSSTRFSGAPELATTQPTAGRDVTPFIRSFNPRSGNADSPVTLMVFIDFECPYCQAAYSTFETLRDRYDAGIHIIFKHFPLESIHPRAMHAALAASCAEEQGRFWEYYQEVFLSKDLSQDALLRYAQTLGLNMPIFTDCVESRRYESHINQDIQDGLTLGVRGTPTYILGTQMLEGVFPLETWDTRIIAAIQAY